MSISLRKLLMQELGVEETKKLLSISKLVRGNSRMTKTEKCECCVCKSKNIQLYPAAKDAQNIYNHHVMKVEYLAILVDKFKLYNEFDKRERMLALGITSEENSEESSKESSKESSEENINESIKNENDQIYTVITDEGKEIPEENIKGYEYVEGFKPFCPRVAVCNDHHTMFHELVGDNPLYLVRDIKIDQAENIVEVFEKLSEEVKAECMINTEHDEMKEYKDSYQRIWDETVTKSLIRLSACVSVNQIRAAASEIFEFIDEGDFEKYEKVLQKIDDIVEYTVKYDEERDITLPEIELFNLNELEKIEADLSRYKTIDEMMLAVKAEIDESSEKEEENLDETSELEG